MDLYRRIRQRREELGMSQEELAKKLGYKSRSTIAKIEKGENDITQTKIAAFAKALDTTPGYLMGWTSKNENIRKARQKLNLTLDDVAKVVGVSRQTIQRYESGVIGNIPSDRIEKLAIALHTSPEILMGWDKNNEVALRISTLMSQYGAGPDEWTALDKAGITPTLFQEYMDGTKIPTHKDLQHIANIFHVSQTWLATGKGSADDTLDSTLNARDKRDIQKRLNAILADMDNDGMAMFNGDTELDDETKELLKASIENSVRLAKIRAKEKFTPKKYKK